MEQDIKVGNAGDVKVEETVAAESAAGTLAIGPLDLTIQAKIDNKKLLEYLAAQVPGGIAHQGIVLLQAALFPSAPSA